MVVLLPALERPAKAISGRPAPGSWLTAAAEVRKRAESKSDMGHTKKKDKEMLENKTEKTVKPF